MPKGLPKIAQAIGRRLAAAGITQTQIAADLGVSQSQVSRLLSGKTKRRSWLFERLQAYAESVPRSTSPSVEASSTEIFAAIKETWDGMPEHARALAHVIRAVSVLRPVRPRRNSRESA